MAISKVKSGVPKHLRNEYRTPRELFKLLDQEFKFVCDVAASPANTLLHRCYTQENSALEADWVADHGPFAFYMNPPFDQKVQFLAKAEEMWKKGATVVCMLRAGAPETEWWRDAILSGVIRSKGYPGPALYPGKWWKPRHEIRYLTPRVRFELPEWEGFQDRPDFPSCLVIMRPDGPVFPQVWWWQWQ